MQMSVIAEFADDDEAVKQLTVVAVREPERFRHLTQRLRDERAEAQVRAAAVAELTEAGVSVIDRDDDRYARRGRAVSAAAPRGRPGGTALEEEAHRDCPGHAAHVVTYRHFADGPRRGSVAVSEPGHPQARPAARACAPDPRGRWWCG